MARSQRTDTPLSESNRFGSAIMRTKDTNPIDKKLFEFFLKHRLKSVLEKQRKLKRRKE